ncbi:hypothetical protein OAF13_02405 [Akkermansiaceae bacterium]|nr:hypothetical protein [Akkermansiaceae bacterium]
MKRGLEHQFHKSLSGLTELSMRDIDLYLVYFVTQGNISLGVLVKLAVK